ncbi:Zinc finger matrin-type protein 5 [Anas platyrhynchos]|uniref:Zinc finger matrin-type protein 5 n=1 Tax=Anas platyrhynchos TaxID=8839 RepID=R0KWL3_ANAPL|nr:Zinc finger matrin-type protein 5 [Anas platyrhynchos]
MGKRYFCDYCDRSFQDNLHNRKKHLNGVQHLRAKRAWYDLFREQPQETPTAPFPAGILIPGLQSSALFLTSGQQRARLVVAASTSPPPPRGRLRFLRALPCLLQPAGENAGALGSCWGALEVRRKRRRQRSAPGRCQLDALRPPEQQNPPEAEPAGAASASPRPGALRGKQLPDEEPCAVPTELVKRD